MPLDAKTIAAAIAASEAAAAFSGVIQVRQDGATVFHHAYGFAQRAERLPNRPDTRFATASGSKIFTAVAVQQLIETGRFTLKTPLRDVLDTPYTLDPAIQVRHLLTHTSGLYDYCDEESMEDDDYFALYARHPVYTMLSPAAYPLALDQPRKFAPGKRFHYNNGAYVALAWLVEQQSGQPFPDYVADHIFTPAGMKDSGYFRMDELPANTAYGYMKQDDGTCRANFFAVPTRGSGDGGAFVTAPDWARFWDALYGHRLLSAAATKAMLKPHADTGHKTLDQHYGYGIWIVQRKGRPYERYVVGEDFGVGMVSITFPGYGVEVTILDNLGDGVWPLWEMFVRLLDETLG